MHIILLLSKIKVNLNSEVGGFVHFHKKNEILAAFLILLDIEHLQCFLEFIHILML